MLDSSSILDRYAAARRSGERIVLPARLVTYDLRDEPDMDFGLGFGCKYELAILLRDIDIGHSA